MDWSFYDLLTTVKVWEYMICIWNRNVQDQMRTKRKQ